MSKSKIDQPSHVSKLPTKDAEYIKGVPVDDSAIADDYMLVYDEATGTLGYESGPAPAAHTIASHSDTTATGAELETLTDGSNADALHAHAAGAGDVVGPAGATNHAIARYDTATGKLLQDSGVIIDDNGQVGIGTDTPDHLLHVLSAAATNAVVLIAAPDGYDASLQFFEGADYGFEFQYDGGDDKLYLWSRKFTGNEAVRMTWMKTGYVGIGETTPTSELHVAGDITVTGTVDGVDVAALSSAYTTHAADITDPHGATMSVSTKVVTPQIQGAGDITLDPYNAADHTSVVDIKNSHATYKSGLKVEGAAGVGRKDHGTVSSSPLSINWLEGQLQTLTLGINLTINFGTAPPVPTTGVAVCYLKIIQGAGTAYTVTFGSVDGWHAEEAYVMSTGLGDIDIIAIMYDGTNYWAVPFGQNFG